MKDSKKKKLREMKDSKKKKNWKETKESKKKRLKEIMNLMKKKLKQRQPLSLPLEEELPLEEDPSEEEEEEEEALPSEEEEDPPSEEDPQSEEDPSEEEEDDPSEEEEDLPSEEDLWTLLDPLEKDQLVEDSKKRKLKESQASSISSEDLRTLLDGLRKDHLVDLLVKLGSQYPSIAGEIRGAASADPVLRKLFVRRLALETTSETLCAALQIYGEIEEGAVVIDKTTGKSRGFGFVTFQHLESIQRALREPIKLIDGQKVICKLACDGPDSVSLTTDLAQRRLYIAGLSPDISSETLLNFFGRHGEIERGYVSVDRETEKSRGFGFVTYKTVEAANKAINDPNRVLGGRTITVRLADSHKTKVVQPQQQQTMVPIATPLPADYGKAHVTTTPVGYSTYPQALVAYPNNPYPTASPQYPQQPQISYAQAPVKRDLAPQASVAYPGPQYPLQPQNSYAEVHVKRDPAPQASVAYPGPQYPLQPQNSYAEVPVKRDPAPQASVAYPGPQYPLQPQNSYAQVPVQRDPAPQSLVAYPSISYPTAGPQYPLQPQNSYGQVDVERDPAGLPYRAPTGVSSYPYYAFRHERWP
ncbi:uncharacterized protein LOC143849987 [Tasmannia lanceolata]|uniref:uncharacterized protein LOC143849987 n=1 Tax=Tasmannia lanceolata TaxID=3420 RepID=UPI004063492D